MLEYTVLVYEADPEEGGYWASVAELPGCFTSGETMEEIEENVKDAIEEYFHALEFAGKDKPQDVARRLTISIT